MVMLLLRMTLLLHRVLHQLVHSSVSQVGRSVLQAALLPRVFRWVVLSDPKLLLCFHLEVHVPERSQQS